MLSWVLCSAAPMFRERSKSRSHSNSPQNRSPRYDAPKPVEKDHSFLHLLKSSMTPRGRKATNTDVVQHSAPTLVALPIAPAAPASTPTEASLQDLRNAYKQRRAASSHVVSAEKLRLPGRDLPKGGIALTTSQSDCHLESLCMPEPKEAPRFGTWRLLKFSLDSLPIPVETEEPVPLRRRASHVISATPRAAGIPAFPVALQTPPLKVLVLHLEPECPKTFKDLCMDLDPFNCVTFDADTKTYLTDAHFILFSASCILTGKSDRVQAMELDHLPQFTDEVFLRLFLFDKLRKINLYQANISLNGLAVLCERLTKITHFNLSHVHCELGGKATEATRHLVFLGILIKNLESLEELDISQVGGLELFQDPNDRTQRLHDLNKRLKLLLAIKTLKRAALCGWLLDGQVLGNAMTKPQWLSLSVGPICWDCASIKARGPQDAGLSYLHLEQPSKPDGTSWGSFEDLERLHSLLPKLILLCLPSVPPVTPEEQQRLRALGLNVYFNPANAPQDPYATWDSEGRMLDF